MVAYPYEGFFGPMDTIKDRQRLEGLNESGRAPVAQGRAPRGARAEAGLMLALSLSGGEAPLRRVLAIGCHADDIEIGCGGTLLALTREHPDVEVTWVVLGAEGERAAEARASAEEFLTSAARAEVVVHGFRDAYMPYYGESVKEAFEELKRVRARPRAHAHARRPASGPPARLRAHVEHVSRPPRSRVRGPEVGR